MSGTPTLHDEPVDMPLKEKSEKDPNPEAAPDRGVEERFPEDNAPSPKPERTEADASDVLIVDWDGPNDPENPRK